MGPEIVFSISCFLGVEAYPHILTAWAVLLFLYASFDELVLPDLLLLLVFGHALGTRWGEALRV